MAGPAAASAATNGADGTAKNNGDDATRGRPYYEKLRRDLKQTLEEKRRLDQITSQTEDRILKLEAAYLDETSAAGNIVKGFDNYIKASGSAAASSSATGGGTATRRKGGVSEADKIFSHSSVSWNSDATPNLVIGTNLPVSNGASHSGTPTATQSGRDTPNSAAGGPSHKGGNKNKRKGKAEADDDDEKSNKRGKITWGRD